MVAPRYADRVGLVAALKEPRRAGAVPVARRRYRGRGQVVLAEPQQRPVVYPARVVPGVKRTVPVPSRASDAARGGPGAMP